MEFDVRALRCRTLTPCNSGNIDDGVSRFTRRTFLISSGVAAASIPAVLETFEGKGRLSIRFDPPESVTFLVDDILRFRIATTELSGSPALSLQRTSRFFRVRLQNARYPGSDIPADLEIEGRVIASEWQAVIRHACGIVAEVPYVRWLVGEAVAAGRWQPQRLFRFAGGGGVDARRGARVRFSPDEHLALEGKGVATLRVSKRRFRADGLTIAPANGATPLLLDAPPSRTRITLARGSHAWATGLSEASGGHAWQLLERDQPFDLATIEAAEDDGRPRRHAVVFENGTADPVLHFVPGTLRAESGSPLEIPLKDVRYAVDPNTRDSESMLLAAFGGGTQLAVGDGFALAMSAPAQSDRNDLEICLRNSTATDVACCPRVEEIITRSPHGLVQTTRLPESSTLPLTWDTFRKDVHAAIGSLRFHDRRTTCSLTTFKTVILRPRDFVFLEFEFRAFRLEIGKDGAWLHPCPTLGTPMVIVEFPPQHIAEKAFIKEAETFEPPPVPSRMANGTRLFFDLSKITEPIPYTVDALLDWSQWMPIVSPLAKSKGTGKPERPPVEVTAIEAPYRLILSPDETERFATTPPPAGDSRTELWTTRLVREPHELCAPDDPSAPLPTVRAIWSRDHDPDSIHCFGNECAGIEPRPCVPFRTSLDQRDRYEIVHLSSDYTFCDVCDGKAFPPAPIDVNLMLLSSLGAWLDLKGKWDPIRIGDCGTSSPPDCAATVRFDVESWKQRSAMGRDNFVEVVYVGFLFPFGHEAVLIKETSRVIVIVNGKPVAHLQQRQYIVVKRPEKTFPALGQPHSARDFPFSAVRLDTTTTPDLTFEVVHSAECFDQPPEDCSVFWPIVKGEAFRFHISAQDKGHDDYNVRFSMPLVFVRLKESFDPAALKEVCCTYEKHARRRTDLAGQKLTMTTEKKSGDATVDASEIFFGCSIQEDETLCNKFRCEHQPFFYPRMQAAGVRIPSVQHFTGTDRPTHIRYASDYVNHDFPNQPTTPRAVPLAAAAPNPTPPNRGEVYAEVVRLLNDDTFGLPSLADRPKLDFPGGRSGGLATPDIAISGISRSMGAIAGNIQNLANGFMDAADFFNGLANAKLLGVIPLGMIFQPVREIQNELQKVPKLILEQIASLTEGIETVRTVIRREITTLEQAILNEVETRIDAALGQLQSSVLGQAYVDARLEARRLRGELARLEAQGNAARREIESTLDLLRRQQTALQSGETVAKEIVDRIKTNFPQVLNLEPIIQSSDIRTFRPFLTRLAALERDIRTFCEQNNIQGKDIAQQIVELRMSFAIDLKQEELAIYNAIEQAAETAATIAHLPTDAVFNRLEAAMAEAFVQEVPIAAIAEVFSVAQEVAGVVEATLARGEPYLTALTRLPDALTRIKNAQDAIADAITNPSSGRVRTMRDRVVAAMNAVNAVLGSSIPVPPLADFLSDVANVVNQVETTIAEANRLVSDAKAQVDAIRAQVDAFVAAIQSAPQVLLDVAKEQLAKMLPHEIVVKYDLEPKLQSAPPSAPIFQVRGDTRFRIRSSIRKKLELNDSITSPPEFSIDASLEKFDIVLFPGARFLILKFEKVTFVSQNLGSPEVSVEGLKVKFGEALQFVQNLQSILPFDKGGNGFYIDVDSDGIIAGYRLTWPDTTVGAFNLYGIAISAAIELPFRHGKSAMVRFAFADRDRPFIMTSGIFGGGGYLAITLAVDHVERLEGALEFGAYAALDLGVAHGAAHILAGIYFRIERDRSILSGFVHAAGHFSVIGLINASLDFYMSITRDNDRVYGDATLTVSIDLFLDTIDVSVTCHREFQGGGSTTARLRKPRMTEDAFVASVACNPLVPESLRDDPDQDFYLPGPDLWKPYKDAFLQGAM